MAAPSRAPSTPSSAAMRSCERTSRTTARPTQVIGPPLSVPLLTEDLQSVSESQRTARVLDILREERETPFDLARGPLLRLRLLRLGADHHLLVRSLHHIVFDQWSDAI